MSKLEVGTVNKNLMHWIMRGSMVGNLRRNYPIVSI